jgi:hypothetical protein
VRSAPVSDGDTLLAARPQRELNEAREQVALAARSLPVILDNFNAVRDQMFSRSGTTGALSTGMVDEQLRVLGTHTSRLSARAAHTNGTLGMALDGALAARAERAIARADSLVQQANGPQSFLGQTQSDSSLVHELHAVQSELSLVSARVGMPGGPGTPGHLDAMALRQRLADADARLRALMADVARRPFRYLNF